MFNSNKVKKILIASNLIFAVLFATSIILNYKLYQLYVFHETKHSELEHTLFKNTYEIPTIQKMSDTENLIDSICSKKIIYYDDLRSLKENKDYISRGLYNYINSFVDTYMNNCYGKTIFNIQPPDIYNTYNYNKESLFNAAHYFSSVDVYLNSLSVKIQNNSHNSYKLNNTDFKKLAIIKDVIKQCRKAYENACYSTDNKNLSQRVKIRLNAIRRLNSLYNEYDLNKKIDEHYFEQQHRK